MYRVVKSCGDTVAVPRLLFSKLRQNGGADKEARFCVALYLLQAGEGEPQQVAKDLGLPQKSVEAALNYWEGAGLLCQDAEPVQENAPLETKRRKLTTREAVSAASEDKNLAVMLSEVQRLFGAVVGESDMNLFVTLYQQDGFAADMILMAAAVAAANKAKKARYVEKVLFSWREAGITDSAAADSYLKLQAEREQREDALAAVMGLAAGSFSLADRKKIAVWFEDYGYGMDMVEAARLVAGDKRSDVKYINGILKQWHGKGYRTPREVQQSGENRNLRVGRHAPQNGSDVLQAAGHAPLRRREQP